MEEFIEIEIGGDEILEGEKVYTAVKIDREAYEKTRNKEIK